jgi:hypothetical protein
MVVVAEWLESRRPVSARNQDRKGTLAGEIAACLVMAVLALAHWLRGDSHGMVAAIVSVLWIVSSVWAEVERRSPSGPSTPRRS